MIYLRPIEENSKEVFFQVDPLRSLSQRSSEITHIALKNTVSMAHGVDNPCVSLCRESNLKYRVHVVSARTLLDNLVSEKLSPQERSFLVSPLEFLTTLKHLQRLEVLSENEARFYEAALLPKESDSSLGSLATLLHLT